MISKIILIFFILINNIYSQNPVTIESFSPEGEVKEIKQVVVRFSESMVPLSSPKVKTDQFIINCPFEGKSRWLDDKTYVYEFLKPLESGVSCSFKVSDSTKSLNGKQITGKKVFEFTTGGPFIIQSEPGDGSKIEENQYFYIHSSAPINEESLLDNLYFSIDGYRDKVYVNLIKGEEESLILKTLSPNKIFKNSFIIKSKLNFPNGKKVSMVFGKGITSKSGVPSSSDQIINYETREPFNISYYCNRENANSGCIPLLDIYLNFSSPVDIQLARKIRLSGGGKIFVPQQLKTDPIEGAVSSMTFNAPFPENTNLLIEVPEDFKDDTARRLPKNKKNTTKIFVAKNPALAKFPAKFGIMELDGDSNLPLSIRNLEVGLRARSLTLSPNPVSAINIPGKRMKISSDQILLYLRKISTHEREKSIFENPKLTFPFEVTQPLGTSVLQNVAIPIKEPGFHVVEIESSILGNSLLEKKGNMYVPTTVLVTGMAVHFKQGKENSLVWVTNLKTAKPVKEANISVRDCKNNLVSSGKTDNNGLLSLKLSDPINCSYSEYQNGYLIIAEKENDLSFVHSSWDNGIEIWRYNLPGNNYYSDSKQYIVHTILDKVLYRAGETVNMKHIFRKQNISGFSIPTPENNPKSIIITHLGTNQKYTYNITWNLGGSEFNFAIPKEAKLGTYQITLEKDSNNSYNTGYFRVEEFRLPILKGNIVVPSNKLINSKEIPITLSVDYLSGGPASNLDVKLKYFKGNNDINDIIGNEDLYFYSKEIKEGKNQRQGYNYYIYDNEDYQEESNSYNEKINKISYKLNSKGTTNIVIDNNFKQETLFNYVLEMEYRDPNGEIQTVSSSVPVYPSNYTIGMRVQSYNPESNLLKTKMVVLDVNNNPISNHKVLVEVFKKNVYSSRKRIVGGFYSYDDIEEISKIGKFCEGKTDEKGILYCEFAPPEKGSLIFQSVVQDISGLKTFAVEETYIPDSEASYWTSYSNTDRIDLLPNKKLYETGENARIQIKSPFSKSTALVTVEREGILDKFIVELNNKDPYIDVPIKKNYAPNIFLSVLLVRGRVDSIKPNATIDLGRPSYKLGITNLNIGWNEHKIDVKVNSDKEVYKIREKAKIKVKLGLANGSPLQEPAEITLVAIDEAINLLSPNTTWNILETFMQTRKLEVTTSTAQMQVIGRRHFGQKGVPQGGGGGGPEITRELFNTLLLWKGTIIPDKSGEAEIVVPLNDSLTSFRIVAIATSGAKLFGTASHLIKTSQDIMLLSGLPPEVREGDELDLELTVRNNTNKDDNIVISGISDNNKLLFPDKKIMIPKGSSEVISWKIKIPENISSVQYDFSAKSSLSSDKIKVSQKVNKVLSVSVRQATLFQLDKENIIPVQPPNLDNLSLGGLNVILKKSLMESTSSIIDYMKKYPYTCVEQQISKAIILKDRESWDKLMDKLPSYMDENGFVKYFPSMYYGSTTLTSYLLSISEESKYPIPENTKKELENALNKFVTGAVLQKGGLETADLNIRKLQSLEALIKINPNYSSLILTLKLNINLLPTSSLIDLWSILDNSKGISDKEDRIKQIENILKSRLNYQGTKITFSTEKNDSLYWLMISGDLNSIKLLNLVMKKDKWKQDIGKISKGVIQRQRNGIWDTTLANAWGIITLEKFTKEFEKESLTGDTKVSYSENYIHNWNSNSKGSEKLLKWDQNIQNISLNHSGNGKPWITVESKSIVKPEEISNGYTIKKEYLDENGNILKTFKQGDIVKIRLKVKSDTDMTWVVINDPIPAGSTILSGGLQDSESNRLSERGSTIYSTFEERSFSTYRLYYEYMSEGEYLIEYTIRLNQSGVFNSPQTRIEAMYSPDMYGEFPNPIIRVVK
jgi:alpha-2-macroglobulin